ncbi:MAG: GGDEF domain-containing protein [Elusimicrobia bacterium]|nr:GGDEF domain-containing protein [Elusimicrobiota bacterium]
MNDNVFLLISSLSVPSAIFAEIALKPKKYRFLIPVVFSLPSLMFSFYRIEFIISAFVCFISFTIFPKRQNTEIKNSDSDLFKIKNIFEKEKKEFEKAAENEKRFSALYVIIKTLSETFDLKTPAVLLKEKISVYLNAKEVSMFLVKENSAEKIFGEDELSSVLEYSQGFEKEDFIFSNDRFYYAFRDGQTVFFFFSVLSQENPEIIKEKLEDLSLEIFPALKRISLFARIDELSVIDGLTGVYRRGAFDEKLSFEFSRAKTFKTSLGLMILDIDHFKKINDSYGHQAGDAVLKKVAEIIRENVYETDFVARYGGEEFALIMPRAQADGALRKAEYIRKLIESEVFEAGAEKIKITVSAGIAHYPKDAQKIEELINKADSALYKAKESGRNRICEWKE